ncbi:MAG: type II secretion system F family protein [Lentisphaeria bacterium]|nr:type II secretion system F family protein [Lentisphaeria bacterium]
MPNFMYVAMDAKGKTVKGKITADTEDQAISEIKKMGLYPSSVKNADVKKAAASKDAAKGGAKKGGVGAMEINLSLGPKKIKPKDLTVLTRQIAILLGAGLPLIRSIKTLQRQSKKPEIKSILAETAESVESGTTFAEALALNPKSFDKLFLNMVRAGEASGAMEIILDRLASFMEKSAKIAGKVKSAMVYPCVVLSVAGLTVTGLMIFIVPNFKKIFTELMEGEPLPGITQFVLNFSDLLKEKWWIAIAFVFGVIVFFKILNKIPQGKWGLDWIKYNMPLFGPIISRTAIARFSRTLGTLMSSGVPVLNALSIVKETSGNEVVASAIQKVYDAVKEGEGIAGPLDQTKIFPAMVVSMVEVGEETGKLPEMMDKIADTYEEEVDNAVGALTSMIEPLMIVGLAVIVGTIVVALFMPLAKIIEKLS